MSKLMKVSLVAWGVFLALVFFTPMAFAAVMTGDPNTHVNIPVGDWLTGIGTAVAAVVAGVAVRLSGPLAGVLQMMRLEQLLQRALLAAMERADIRPGKVITVDVKNELIADAARYAIRNGSAAVIKWAGGIEALKEKLEARIIEIVRGKAG